MGKCNIIVMSLFGLSNTVNSVYRSPMLIVWLGILAVKTCFASLEIAHSTLKLQTSHHISKSYR